MKSRRVQRAEIEMIVEAFGEAALRVKKSGFDGVEISAAHCHLIDQFWGPHVNFRDDEFGGEVDNRMRFGFMVISACGARSAKTSSSAFVSPATILSKADSMASECARSRAG